jgi:hypothetical protein
MIKNAFTVVKMASNQEMHFGKVAQISEIGRRKCEKMLNQTLLYSL